MGKGREGTEPLVETGGACSGTRVYGAGPKGHLLLLDFSGGGGGGGLWGLRG